MTERVEAAERRAADAARRVADAQRDLNRALDDMAAALCAAGGDLEQLNKELDAS